MYHVFILARKPSDYNKLLKSHINNSTIIYDCDIDDKKCIEEGFVGLTKTVKTPSAWDKAFRHIHLNQEQFKNVEFFFFIEDDVYSRSLSNINNLIEDSLRLNSDLLSTDIKSRSEKPEWPHWGNIPDCFLNHFRSFNPICRLSNRLVSLVLKKREVDKVFLYNEIAFICIAVENNLSYKNWKDTCLSKYFGTFVYRPVIHQNSISDEKIYHPIKQAFIGDQ